MLDLVIGALAGAALLFAGVLIGRRYAPPLVVTVQDERPGPGQVRSGSEDLPVVALSDRELWEDEQDDGELAEDGEHGSGRPYGPEDEEE